ncbi:MAG: zinc-binding dehydrogenase [Alphaproteobacteria bacterium]
MRAVVAYGHGDLDDLKYETGYRDPEPGADEVILRVRACSMNYHDLFTLRGMPGIKIGFPRIMGIDVAGDVAALGKDVAGWKVGDRVCVDPIDRHGKFAMIGETRDGGLAEYVAVKHYQMIALPADVSYEAGAALPTAYGTAHRMMLERGQIKAGEKVLVLGASGGVGTCCVQLAKQAGCEVIAAASTEEKLEKLKGIGADHGINYASTDFTKAIHEMYGKPRIFGEGGVDVIVNFTGGDTWVASLKALSRGGRMLTCGATAGYSPQTDIRYIWTFEHDIKGSNGWSVSDIEALLAMCQDGRLTPVIDRTLPLTEGREAFRVLDDREVFGKVIVSPDA